jgi:hypothetical protein
MANQNDLGIAKMAIPRISQSQWPMASIPQSALTKAGGRPLPREPKPCGNCSVNKTNVK